MKILQINTRDAAGGAESSAYNLFHKLREQGHQSWLAVGYKTLEDPDIVEIPNQRYRSHWAQQIYHWRERMTERSIPEPVCTAASNLLRYLAEPRRWLEWRMGYEDFYFPGTNYLLDCLTTVPDLIHCHNLHGGYFDLRALPPLSHRIPVILNLRDSWLLSGHCAHSFDCDRWMTGCGNCPDLYIYPAVRRDATRYNWRRKKQIFEQGRYYIVTPSQWMMNRVQRSMLKGEDYKVIPNAIDTRVFFPSDKEQIRKKLDLPLNSKILLFTSNLGKNSPWRDYSTVETAFLRLREKYPDENNTILLCLGGSIHDQSTDWIKYVPYEKDLYKVADYYRAADVYLLAAKAEAFGKTITESMACGTPVVATAVGGIPEQIQDGLNGFLVPPADAEAMSERIHQLLHQPDLYHQFQQQSLGIVQNNFTLEIMVRRFVEYYQEILEKRPVSDSSSKQHGKFPNSE